MQELEQWKHDCWSQHKNTHKRDLFPLIRKENMPEHWYE